MLDKARMARVRARMDELDVDAVLLSHGADLPWLTGYRAMPLERLTLLVLPRHGDPVMVVPALEAPRVPLGASDDALFTLRPWLDDEDPIALGHRHRLGGVEAPADVGDLRSRLGDVASRLAATTARSPVGAGVDGHVAAAGRQGCGRDRGVAGGGPGR